jgi:tetratricopeptide (TPR) repeat protein
MSTATQGWRIAAMLAACALAAPAAAQDEPDLGSGLKLSGAPTIQEILAAQRACEVRKPKKPAGTLSESTFRRLERAMNLVSQEKYGEAEPKLNEMLDETRGDYEKAIILQTLAFVYASTKRELQGIKAFEQAIATNALPPQTQEQMMFNVAQLYLAEDMFDKGMEKLRAYIAESCNPLPDAHVQLAAVHAEKKQWRESLKQIDIALVKAKAPKEAWLQLKLALHYELKEFPRCAEVLVHLVALNPIKEEYWKQLSGMLLELRKDPEALAALSLAERRGYVNEEGEYRNLANLYMYMQVPVKAASLLDRGFAAKEMPATEKNFEMLANAWLMAREYDKAEVAMARAAAASDKGEMFKRLGQIQMENENWKAALESLKKAQKKGGLKEPGETAFLIGVVAFNLKQWDLADQSLRAAMTHEKSAKMAAEWLNYLQAEIAYMNATEAAEDKPDDTKTN